MVAGGALLLAGCGDDGGDAAAELPVLTDADSGTQLALATGDRFQLRLESNPSTGYQWALDRRSMPDAVDLLATRYEPPPDDDDVVGRPGVEVFEFVASGPGAGIVRLEYLRLFDDPPIPERIVEYIVSVDGVPWPPDRADQEVPATATAVAGPVLQIADLLAGDGATDVTVRGSVLWDGDEARLCAVLMESHPPQCGGDSIPIANPDRLTLALEEHQGIRWTPQPVELAVDYDGRQLRLR